MTNRLAHILLAACVLLTAAACQLRPLEDPSEVVRIKVDVNVKAVTNVNANIRNSVHIYGTNVSLWEEKLEQLRPELMRVLVYDPDTDKLLAQSFISAMETGDNGDTIFSGNLGISYGNYNFLVYNFDTPTTQVTAENTESGIIAYTSEISSSTRRMLLGTKAEEPKEDNGYAGMSIRYEPEHLMVGNERNIRISPHDTLVIIRTEATTVVDTYYLQVRVRGLQFASSATAVISGLSPSNRIGLNQRTVDEPSAVAFELKKARDTELGGDNQDILFAVFNTFGKIEDVNSELVVTFNVYDTAGNLLQYKANMDQVFKSELAINSTWLIIDDSVLVIDIPEPAPDPDQPGTSGGFQPQVDDWEEETGEIVL